MEDSTLDQIVSGAHRGGYMMAVRLGRVYVAGIKSLDPDGAKACEEMLDSIESAFNRSKYISGESDKSDSDA